MGKFGERILATDRLAGRRPANFSARARGARPLGRTPPARPHQWPSAACTKGPNQRVAKTEGSPPPRDFGNSIKNRRSVRAEHVIARNKEKNRSIRLAVSALQWDACWARCTKKDRRLEAEYFRLVHC
jgi:hypothetical protein